MFNNYNIIMRNVQRAYNYIVQSDRKLITSTCCTCTHKRTMISFTIDCSILFHQILETQLITILL